MRSETLFFELAKILINQHCDFMTEKSISTFISHEIFEKVQDIDFSKEHNPMA